MTIGKTNDGSIEYFMTLNNTKHPLDTIEKQKDIRHKAVL